MNNIFIKNLSALFKKNPTLATILEKYVLTEVPQISNQNGFYNLLYKNKYIHNVQNPLAESQTIFSQVVNNPTSIHLIYGLGLGYLFQIASLNSKGSVILYEPDLNILWMAFTLVDFTNEILKNNVYITNTFDDVSAIIYKNSQIKNTPQLISLPSQREFNSEEFDILVKKLQELVGSFALDLKYMHEKIYPSLLMLLENITSIKNETPLSAYKDIYKGKTAVIVSAGPTLDRNIEILKKNRKKYILFTVGTALKTLMSNGIKPDFLTVIETYDSSKQLEGLDLSDINFITEPYSNPVLRNFKFKKSFSHISANMPVNHFWGDIIGENIEEYWSIGTVSYTALNSARLLGCSNIILVGQDLAYIEGQCYSKDSAYKDLVCGINPETNCWEIMAKDINSFAKILCPSQDYDVQIATAKRRLKNLNNSLYVVKGINGDMIPTESVYATFIPPFEEFVKKYNDRVYINTSLVGAQINGFENISLEEALKESTEIGNIEFETKPFYDLKQIHDRLNSKVEELNEVLVLIDNGYKALRDLNNNIKRYKSPSLEVLKSLKKLSLIYLDLSTNFTNKFKLYDYITINYRLDIDYELKMTEKFTLENIQKISNDIKEFFESSKSRIFYLQDVIGNLDENLNTKS